MIQNRLESLFRKPESTNFRQFREHCL
ncbi:hypothetical protein ACXOQL_03530 [Streptococcus thermophilus]